MASAELRYNERAWAIDLISFINCTVHPDDVIRRASGEHTLSAGGHSLFPDVLLFGDQTLGCVLQGWELKMPDTRIDDAEFVLNAEKKARNLGLNSFVVWNVAEAYLYVLGPGTDCFVRHNESLFFNPAITTRADVQNHPELWQQGAVEVLQKLNLFFRSGVIVGVSPESIFSDTGLVRQLLLCQSEVKAFIESKIQTDNQTDAKIKIWWKQVRHEYPGERRPSGPLAFRILFRWFNRFVFANILKAYQYPLREIEGLNRQTTISQALTLFSDVSRRLDYWNVFGRDDFDELIPSHIWDTLVTIHDLLKDFEFGRIDRSVLQSILKSVVLTSIKKAAGLYVTPAELAKLLVLLSLEDKTGLAIDPFCGTGTIVKAILEVKSDYHVTGRQAVQTTWGSDKFAFPVQVATLAISTPENMNEPMRIFTHDAFRLSVGENISLVDPSDGSSVDIRVSRFSAIISNAPFVRFEDVTELNRDIAERIDHFYSMYSVPQEDRLDGRGDLYSYIPFLLYDLLEENGTLGLIVSNAWLSTGWGKRFRQLLRRFYRIKYVITSANGRWFSEADVVTNIIVCQKLSERQGNEEIRFIATNENLNEMDVEGTAMDILADSFPSEKVNLSVIHSDQLVWLDALNMGWTSCFADNSWLMRYSEKFVHLSSYTAIARGERRGWNALFYPAAEHLGSVEEEFLTPVFRTMQGCRVLSVVANEKAFCCSLSIDDLIQQEKTGALSWIRRFENQRNTTNALLSEVLSRPNLYWYQMDANTRADFVLSMNPDRCLFVARFSEPTFVDQRLIRLTLNPEIDMELLHALLNSTISMFQIEAIGFGRGLGVLDINATKIRQGFRVPDLNLISKVDTAIIRNAFTSLLSRQILPVDQELLQTDRRALDIAILNALQIPETELEKIYAGLSTLYKIRKSVGR